MTRKEYISIHSWLRKNYGRPQECESSDCNGKSKTYDWALKQGKDHSKSRINYKRLCRSCHVKYDMTDAKKLQLIKISHTDTANKKRGDLKKDKPLLEIHKKRISKGRRKTAKKYCVKGECKSLVEWADEIGADVRTVWARIARYGFSPEEAFKLPVRKVKLYAEQLKQNK